MKRLSLFFLAMLVSVPLSASGLPPSIKNIDWLPENTVRIAQGINAAYRISTTTGQTIEMWTHINCRTQEKKLLFINMLPPKELRVYSTYSPDHYVSGTVFEPDADSLFITKPELDLCKQYIPESSWAGIASHHQSDDKLYVDVNNSLREGVILKLRLATDYDKIYHDKKYGAPYSVKIDDILLNCENQQSMKKATFSLDNQGFITDTETTIDAVFSPLTPKMGLVAATLCPIRDLRHYQGTGTLSWRDKTIAESTPAHPDLEHNTPAVLQKWILPTEVLQVIRQTFSDPQQKPNFRSLTYTQNRPEKDGFGLTVKIDAQPDGTTLSLHKTVIGDVVFYSQYQRLFNVVDIKKWESMSEAPWVSKTLDYNITLPLRLNTVYSSHSLMVNSAQPETTRSLSQTCVTSDQWHNAAGLNRKFPGRYRVVMCKQDLGDGKEASSDYAYLESLKVFIRIGFQVNGQPKRFTFTDVDILR